jgi:ribokinase
VVGQVARDLVLVVEETPDAGRSTGVRDRRELLGGKGANQAVAMAQLGGTVALVGVVGDDPTAEWLLDQAMADKVDVSPVIRRANTATGLIVDIVDGAGHWRYLEDFPLPVRLTVDDVTSASDTLRAAAATIIQLQQPAAAALTAARIAKEANRLVVLDGAPTDPEILSYADVLRADAHEARLLTGKDLDSSGEAVAAASELLTGSLRLIVLAVDGGNLFAWDGGHELLPLLQTEVVDTTGSGDAFVAALTLSLLRNRDFRTAARLAVAAAAATVGHPGGRPELTRERLALYVTQLNYLAPLVSTSYPRVIRR